MNLSSFGRRLLGLPDAATLLTIAGAQPLDADLTSWAGITRAAGFDTFATTPSSANLATLLTDESGTGSVAFESTGTWTPTITATSGTFTTTSASGAYTKTGRQVSLRVNITITTVGTASGGVIFTLPFTANASGGWVLAGRENASTGKMLQALINGGATTATAFNYDNTSTIGAGFALILSGVYWV